MLPHYTETSKECEFCESEIYVGYECLYTQDGYFCDEECLSKHLLAGESYSEIYLVKDKAHKEWD